MCDAFIIEGVIMLYKAENDFFTLAVKEMGAELNSLKSKKTGIEYIWFGDEKIWYGQSPILFPIIGRLLDDKYTLNGVEYSMEKHGIVRKKPFKLIENTEDSLTFVQTDDEDSIKAYPYQFELKVTFQLTENGLKVSHIITNNSKETMYYSFGAHPGFNCEIGDYLEFSDDTKLFTERIDTESILIDEKFPVEMNDNKIELTKTIFDKDALILSSFKSKNIKIKSNNHNRIISFDFDSPFLGIWAKPNAPYVCIEPWWGVNDDYNKKADFSQKRGIMSLLPDESKEFSWEVSISE